MTTAARQICGSLVLGALLALSGNEAARADLASPVVTEIGNFGGGQSEAFGVTDGGVVVGDGAVTNDYSQYRAYRWTQGTGMADLGTLGGTYSLAVGVSADGSVVVGYADLTGSSAYHAFRWAQAGGMGDLGTLGGTNSSANGVSADGGVVVGWADLTGSSANHAFRWTQGTGMADLGTLACEDHAIKEIIAEQLAAAMEEQGITKVAMAARMKTSTNDANAIYTLRGIINSRRLGDTGREAPALVDDIMGKDCPVSTSLTADDKAKVLAIKQDAVKNFPPPPVPKK